MKTATFRLFKLGVALVALFAAADSAQATRFTGQVNTLWSNDANWEGGFGPGNAAVIPSGLLVDLDVAVGIGSVTMEPNSNIRNAGGSLSISGSFNIEGGTIGVDCQDPNLPVSIGSGATLTFSGSAGKGVSSCVVINNAGHISWSGGPVFFDGTLNNAGLFTISSNAGFGSASRSGVINNTGRIEKISGNGVTQFAGFTPETNSIATAINNNGGVVAVASGTIEMGPGTSNGEFFIGAGKTLLVSQGHTFDEATFTGTGTCSVTTGITFLGHVTTTADIELTGQNNSINGGTTAFPVAFLDGTARFFWKSGRLAGTLTLGEGIHSILSEGPVKSFDGEITNKGTMDWVGGGALASNSSTFHNEGTFNVLAEGTFLADTYINGSGFDNSGTLNTVPNGTNLTDDNFMTNSGVVNIGGVGGTGIFRPRGFAQTATGVLNIEVAGANASTPQFDQIVGGSLQIDGTLNVALLDGYTPANGDRFTLVTSHGGEFAHVSLPGSSGRFSLEDPGNAPTVLVSNSSALILNDLWAAGRDLAANELPDRGTDAVATNERYPQWSYGYRSEIIGALTLFTQAEHQNGLGQTDVDGWSSGPAGNAVSISVNTGSTPVTISNSTINSVSLKPGQLLMLPTPSNYVVARWTASEAGTYNIAARWVDADATSGNGAIAHVVVNGAQIFGGQDSSSKLFTGARWNDGGKVAMAPRSLRLEAGATVDFVVGSNGDSTHDLTAMNAVIRRAPDIAIAAPASVTAGQDVNVTVSSSGVLTGVTLQQDGSTVRTITEAPFEFLLEDLTPGIYQLQAEGITADGILAASNVITLTVNDAPAARPAAGHAATAAIGSTYEAVVSGTWSQADIWRRKSDNANGVPGANDVAIIPASVQIVLDSNRTIGKLFCEGIIAGESGNTTRELTANKQLSISGLARDLSLHIASTAVLTNVKGSAFFENVKVQNDGRMVISQSLYATGSEVKSMGEVLLRPPPASGGPVILKAPQVQLAGVVTLAPGTAVAGRLVGMDGSTLVGNDGSTLVGNDGSTLVGNDGSTLVGNDGSTLVGNDGSTLVGNDGSTLVGNDGSTLVGNDGASLAQINAGALVSQPGLSRPSARLDGTVQSGITVDGGVLAGTCNLIGDVTMTGGFITPGRSAGQIVIAGDLTLDSNSTTVLEIGGSDGQPSASDKLSVLGNAALDGKLILRTINGYTPQPNDTFQPLTYSSKSGAFDSISSNAQITFGANSATAQVSGPNPPAPKALNISTRARVEGGDNVLIGGFIITGSQAKQVIVRAIGPSLTAQGVGGALTNPKLDLYGASGLLRSNDDWRSTQEQEISAAGFAPSSNLESAILITLQPGAYTAIVSANGPAGVGLVEVYDLSETVPAQLANISTRGVVRTGDNVMIGGFILRGDYPSKILVRAVGPSLANAGVPNVLANPTLQLVDSNGSSISNDDWRSSQEAEIIATTIAPTDDREAAILALLPPGAYTAIVRGQGDTTGVALVEAYNLP